MSPEALDFIAFLNANAPGDPVVFRVAVTGLVALAAFLWPLEMRKNWVTWTRRTRRQFAAVLPLLIVNGGLLLSAAERQDPIRVGTYALAISFVLIATTLLLRFRNDDTTDRHAAPWRRR